MGQERQRERGTVEWEQNLRIAGVRMHGVRGQHVEGAWIRNYRFPRCELGSGKGD